MEFKNLHEHNDFCDKLTYRDLIGGRCFLGKFNSHVQH
jgi:hypothetical protein